MTKVIFTRDTTGVVDEPDRDEATIRIAKGTRGTQIDGDATNRWVRLQRFNATSFVVRVSPNVIESVTA